MHKLTLSTSAPPVSPAVAPAWLGISLRELGAEVWRGIAATGPFRASVAVLPSQDPVLSRLAEKDLLSPGAVRTGEQGVVLAASPLPSAGLEHVLRFARAAVVLVLRETGTPFGGPGVLRVDVRHVGETGLRRRAALASLAWAAAELLVALGERVPQLTAAGQPELHLSMTDESAAGGRFLQQLHIALLARLVRSDCKGLEGTGLGGFRRAALTVATPGGIVLRSNG